MPVTKMALLRYQIIDQCLTNHYRIWTEVDLLNSLSSAINDYSGSDKGISRSTLFADFRAMKPGGATGYEAPIKYTAARGYHYTDPDYSISQTPLSSPDVVVLQQALQALQSIRGIGLVTALDDIIRRLERRLAPIADAIKAPAPIQFEAAPEYTGTAWLQPLYEAIQQRQVLQLLYQPYHAVTASEVVVHPYLLKMYQHRWFLVGYGPMQDDLRVFALDRINNVTRPAIRYVPPAVDLNAHFQHVIGLTVPQGNNPTIVHLRFSRGRGPYVRTKPLHSSQRILSDTQAGLELTLYVVPNPELMTHLLAFGPDMEVLAPASLRTAIQRRLRVSLAHYSK